MEKKDSNITYLIFDGEVASWSKYDGEVAIVLDKWIKDREDIKSYIKSVLSVTDQLLIPEHLIETYFNSSRNLLNIIDND